MKNNGERKTENTSVEPVVINYGSGVVSVPAAALRIIGNATGNDVKILLCLMENPSAGPEEICSKLGITDTEIFRNAVAFWRGAGIVSDSRGDSRYSGSSVRKKADDVIVAIPTYTAGEVSEIAENNKSIGHMLDECTEILGKVFGETENAKLISAVEYFGIDPEYVVLICAHCAKLGKRSVGFVINTVASLCKAGITTVPQLNDYLLGIEKSAKLETQVRQLVGMNMTRELTARERSFITTWGDVYGYGIEIIRMAYEITVDAIGEPVLAYMNAVLGRWFENGLITEQDIKEAVKKEKKDRKDKTGRDDGKSFDTDDFFAAALSRSYGAGADIPEVPSSSVPDTRNVGKTSSQRNNKKVR